MRCLPRIPRAIAAAVGFACIAGPSCASEAEVIERDTRIEITPEVTLGCTATMPMGVGPYPGAVLLSVAGPNDRDQSLFSHRGFRDLAHGLARSGIASLRCDDRGVGDSAGELLNATYDDLAGEASRRLGVLAALPEVDPERVGFIGNSEGGAIGPLAATRDDQAAFVVLLAGPGKAGAETLRLQLEAAIRGRGIEAGLAASLRERYDRFLEIQTRDPDDLAVRAEMRAFLEGGGRALFPPYGFIPRDLDGLTDYLLSAWHRSMIAYDPLPVLSRLDRPILALSGDKDRTLEPAAHLESIRRAVRGNPRATIELLPGLNHLFQTAVTGSPNEYAMLPEAISRAAVTRIASWISGLSSLTSRDATTVFLVRHAEPLFPPLSDRPDDPPLNLLGQQRAHALARLLAEEGLDRVFATEWRRARETAQVVAAELGLDVTSYRPQDLHTLAAQISDSGANSLIVGHSNTTPELVTLLGGNAGDPIAEGSEFDRLYALTLVPGQPPETRVLRYGVPLPEDWRPPARKRRLTHHPAQDRHPTWSRDGRRLAFESNRTGNWDLFLLSLDGALRPLTTSPSDDRFPQWHPRQDQLLFSSDRAGQTDLYALDLDRQEIERLTDTIEVERFPQWSPDGQAVIYSTKSADERWDLHLLDLETGASRVLYSNRYRILWPRISPDGQSVLFFSRLGTEGKEDDLYVLDLRSLDVAAVVEQPGHDFCPSWGPDPGEVVFASSSPEGLRSIEVRQLGTDRSRRFGVGFARVTEPVPAPGGEMLAYTARTEAGEMDIYLEVIAAPRAQD